MKTWMLEPSLLTQGSLCSKEHQYIQNNNDRGTCSDKTHFKYDKNTIAQPFCIKILHLDQRHRLVKTLIGSCSDENWGIANSKLKNKVCSDSCYFEYKQYKTTSWDQKSIKDKKISVKISRKLKSLFVSLSDIQDFFLRTRLMNILPVWSRWGFPAF